MNGGDWIAVRFGVVVALLALAAWLGLAALALRP